MSMPFYVSPEQVMADKAEFARKGIARGKSSLVSTLAADENVAVLFVPAAEEMYPGPSRTRVMSARPSMSP